MRQSMKQSSDEDRIRTYDNGVAMGGQLMDDWCLHADAVGALDGDNLGCVFVASFHEFFDRWERSTGTKDIGRSGESRRKGKCK